MEKNVNDCPKLEKKSPVGGEILQVFFSRKCASQGAKGISSQFAFFFGVFFCVVFFSAPCCIPPPGFDCRWSKFGKWKPRWESCAIGVSLTWWAQHIFQFSACCEENATHLQPTWLFFACFQFRLGPARTPLRPPPPTGPPGSSQLLFPAGQRDPPVGPSENPGFHTWVTWMSYVVKPLLKAQ